MKSDKERAMEGCDNSHLEISLYCYRMCNPERETTS